MIRLIDLVLTFINLYHNVNHSSYINRCPWFSVSRHVVRHYELTDVHI